MKRAIVSAVGMVLAAAMIASVFNAVRPSGIPFVGDWSPKAVTQIHAGDLEVIHLGDAFELFSRDQALFIDAREPGAYNGGHIPGSVNITPEQASERIEEVHTMLKSGKVLIAYCYDVDCPLGAELVKKLQELGTGPIKVMPEGWTGWLDRGYPYE